MALQRRPPPRHPIAIALSEASKTVHIAPYHLKRVVEARVRFLVLSFARHRTNIS